MESAISVIACETTEDELNKVFRETGLSYPVTWIERQLHDSVTKLRARLEDALLQNQSSDVILFSMAVCGTAFDGLGSASSELIIPRCPDCTGLFLASPRETDSCYFTRGWMTGKRSLVSEYQRVCEKFGTETANGIYETVFKNYRSFSAIDTGAYPVAEISETLRDIAGKFDIPVKSCKGTTNVLKKLIMKEWDEDFIRLKPGESFEMSRIADGTVTLKTDQTGEK